MTSDSIIVRDAAHMPVCTDGKRLVFVREALMTIERGGIRITRLELPGDWWDGASIPMWAQFIIGRPFLQRYRWASYWHDRFCEMSRNIEDRTLADAMFLQLLKEAEVLKPLRLAMWLAVRLYGLTVWRMKLWVP